MGIFHLNYINVEKIAKKQLSLKLWERTVFLSKRTSIDCGLVVSVLKSHKRTWSFYLLPGLASRVFM